MTRAARNTLLAALLFAGSCGITQAAQKTPPKPKPDPVAALDDVKKWPARDFANATAISCPICVYIKDADAKNNKDAEKLEGADFLGNEEIRVKLRGFTRVKIKNDGTNSKGWPGEWLKAAEGGAVLILFSSDKTKTFPFSQKTLKKEFTKEGLLTAIDTLLKYEAEKKAAAEAKLKEEAAKNVTPADEKAAVLGLDPTKKAPEEPKPKPKPQQTPVENE
jgi:hypothetical protein